MGRTLKTYRDFLFHTDELGDFVNNFILDQCAIHIEHRQPLMPSENTFLLQNHLDVPLALEAPDAFMFPQIIKREIFRVWWWGEGDLYDLRLVLPVEASVGGIHPLVWGLQTFHDLEEVGQAQLRDIWAVEVIQWLRLRHRGLAR